jgi:hypothetical protein
MYLSLVAVLDVSRAEKKNNFMSSCNNIKQGACQVWYKKISI